MATDVSPSNVDRFLRVPDCSLAPRSKKLIVQIAGQSPSSQGVRVLSPRCHLPKWPSAVAPGLEGLGERDLFLAHGAEVVQAGAERRAAGHDREPPRRAHLLRGVEVIEPHASLAIASRYGVFACGLPVAGVSPAQIVRHDDDEIRRRCKY